VRASSPAVSRAGRLELPPALDRAASAPLLLQILGARGEDLKVDASAVRRFSPYALQVLLAARIAWLVDGRTLRVEQPSPELLLNLALMGAPFEATFEDEGAEPEAPDSDEDNAVTLEMLVRAIEALRAQADERGAELSAAIGNAERYLEDLRQGRAPVPPPGVTELLLSAQELFEAVGSIRGATGIMQTAWLLHFRPLNGPSEQAGLPFLNLSRLGELELKLDANALPPLASLDPARFYLAWSMTLQTSVDEAAIRRAFQGAAGGYLLDLRAAT